MRFHAIIVGPCSPYWYIETYYLGLEAGLCIRSHFRIQAHQERCHPACQWSGHVLHVSGSAGMNGFTTWCRHQMRRFALHVGLHSLRVSLICHWGKIIDLFFEIHMFIFRFILFQNSKPVCQTGHPTITSWWPAKIANAIRTTKASWWPAIVHVLGMAVICSIANSLQVSERRCGCDRIFQLQAVLAISRFRGPWWLTGKKLFLCEPPTSVLTCAGCGIVFLEAVCQPCKICVTLSS